MSGGVYVRRPESIGPWILAAAVVHALFLVLGICAVIEYQKSQVRSAIQNAQEQRQPFDR